MPDPLVIIGAGGFGGEALDIVDAINALAPTWDMLGFIVDHQYGRTGEIVHGKPILGNLDWLRANLASAVVCGIGAPEVRLRLIRRAATFGARFVSLVHPTVIQTQCITLGQGIVIAAGCIISNTVQIGDHVHINPGSVIGHDVTIEPFASLAPGVRISGNVRIGEGAYVGTGANIIERKRVGEWSIVGAGSTIIKDVPPNTTVVGVPARVIKERRPGWQLNEN